MMLLDRRNFLKTSTAAVLTLAAPGFGFVQHYNDNALLDDLSHRCFQHFYTLPGRSELYLVIPIRPWDEQHVHV
jgi:hypothetical protein